MNRMTDEERVVEVLNGKTRIWRFTAEEPRRHFGSDQSVWRDGDWNGFVRIALAGLLDLIKSRFPILSAFYAIILPISSERKGSP